MPFVRNDKLIERQTPRAAHSDATRPGSVNTERSHRRATDALTWMAMSVVLVALFLVVMSATASRVHAASAEWSWHKTADGLHPDGREQQRLWLINRARQNPGAEGEWLANSQIDDISAGRDAFNVNVAKLIREFNVIKAAPPAAFDNRLYAAAHAHARDLIQRDSQDHNGQFELVGSSGFRYQFVRGNVFTRARNSLYAHAAFNIDWGPGTSDGMQNPRGHRIAIMGTKDKLPNVGIAVVRESNAQTQSGPWVHVDNFATAFPDGQSLYNAFVVGTVWRDLNNNKRYDVGEGVEGVLVNPDRGDYYAVTSPGGGYAFPITEQGRINVSFSGGGVAEHTATVTAGTTSVLLDYIPGAGASAGSANTTPPVDALGNIDLWLDYDSPVTERYGYRSGGVAVRDTVRMRFNSDGYDARLTLRSFDIDERGEVSVFFNGSFVANLRAGLNNQFNGGDVVLLSRQLMRTDQPNEVVIQQNTSGWRWGIENMTLSRLQAGAEVTLTDGVVSRLPRGWNYRGDTHKGAVITQFNVNDNADRFISLIGYDIDNNIEATVFLNGRRIGAIRTSPNNGHNSGNRFRLKSSLLKQGNNRLIIVQKRPGNTWGLRDLLLEK